MLDRVAVDKKTERLTPIGRDLSLGRLIRFKMDGEPAKNPSLWIARTALRFTNAKTGDFWLPEQTRSETKVRIGGTAVLTINYGVYQVAPRESRLAPGL